MPTCPILTCPTWQLVLGQLVPHDLSYTGRFQTYHIYLMFELRTSKIQHSKPFNHLPLKRYSNRFWYQSNRRSCDISVNFFATTAQTSSLLACLMALSPSQLLSMNSGSHDPSSSSPWPGTGLAWTGLKQHPVTDMETMSVSDFCLL